MSIPVNSITAGSLAANASDASSSADSTPLPQIQMLDPIPAPGESVAQPTAKQSNPSQLSGQLSDALKKSGINAEIELNGNGYMIVKYVDQSTQHLLFQIPNQTVLDLIRSLSQASRDNQNAGALIDKHV